MIDANIALELERRTPQEIRSPVERRARMVDRTIPGGLNSQKPKENHGNVLRSFHVSKHKTYVKIFNK